MIVRALGPVFNFFCNKETGHQLSDVINLYLVYMYENIISQNADFKNYTLKDLVSDLICNVLCWFVSLYNITYILIKHFFFKSGLVGN